MLEQLTRLTTSDDYLEHGTMRIKEVLVRPWEEKEVLITLEIIIDLPSHQEADRQTWQIACKDVMYNTSNRIHEPKVRPQIKVLTHHPVLWNYGRQTYFSVSGICNNISQLMGDLFAEHDKACGGWVDFHWLYSGLPETLLTQRENQLAVPSPLADTCFKVLKKYDIGYIINEECDGETGLSMLLFSDFNNWDDNYSWGQPYLIAKEYWETLK